MNESRVLGLLGNVIGTGLARAEGGAAQLKRWVKKPSALRQGQQLYDEAKAASDGAIAHLLAALALGKEPDEDKKLRHVINNASGTLRPLVQTLFASQMTPEEFQEFLTLIFYPAEVTENLERTMIDPNAVRAFAMRTLPYQLELVLVLSSRYSLKRATRSFGT